MIFGHLGECTTKIKVFDRSSMPVVSFPSCFGAYGQRAQDDKSSHNGKVVQSSVICLYQPKSAAFCRPVLVTWWKGLLGQGFSVSLDEPDIHHVCKVDTRLWRFWKRQGSKTVHAEGKRLQVFWDFSDAKYTWGPEPHEGFFVAVLCDGEIVLLLGDMQQEAYKRAKLDSSVMVVATMLSKKEHLFGKKVYQTRAKFEESGLMHDITVECHVVGAKEPWLCVRVDKQAVMHIKHLMWKFRGNETFYVDGLPIEILWDVHDWLFNADSPCAVFMFHTLGASEKGDMARAKSGSIMEWPASHSFKDNGIKQLVKDTSVASILEWPNTYSFKGVKELQEASPGFSLHLYAWRSE